MLRLNYFVILLILLAVSLPMTFAQRVTVEPARSEILPFNSDSLYLEGSAAASLYVAPIEEWRREGDSFFAKYTFPFEWLNRTVLMRIDYVGAPYRLEVNGEQVAICEDGITPIEYNLTGVTLEGLNQIALHIDREGEVMSIESWRVNENGEDCAQVEVRGAVVLAPAKMTVRDVELRTRKSGKVLSSTISVALKSYNLNERESKLHYKLIDPNGKIASHGAESMMLSMRGEDTLYISAILPDTLGWSAHTPNKYRLDLALQWRGWYVENHRYDLGLRSVTLSAEGDLVVNGRKEPLRCVEVGEELGYDALMAIKRGGANTIILGAGVPSARVLEVCGDIGLYVIFTAPINSRAAGESIARWGNPTNDPEWRERYIERAERSYHSAKRHPSIVAYAIAEESRNGINLYEVYLEMKSLEEDLPIIYRDGGGEWNSDMLNYELQDGK